MLGASSYLLPGKILWDERPATNRKIFNCSLLYKPRGTQLCVLKLVLKHLIKCQLKGLSEPGSGAGGSQPCSQDNPPPGCFSSGCHSWDNPVPAVTQQAPTFLVGLG